MPTSAHTDSSETPLPKKLGIREGSRVLVLGSPAGFSFEPLPGGVDLLRTARKRLDVAVLFVTSRADLERRFPRLAGTIAPDGRLWVAWPKKASGIETDLTFDAVQRTGLDAGLVDNKSASITDAYQGLQFVVRLRDRGLTVTHRVAAGTAPGGREPGVRRRASHTIDRCAR